MNKKNIYSPRGKELSCKDWQIESAFRMIQNNLDVDVAEDPENFSISDVNRQYIKAGDAVIHSSDKGTWVDCGTPDGLLHAAKMASDGLLDPTPHRL